MGDSDFVRDIRSMLGNSGKPFGVITIVDVTDEQAGDELEEAMRDLTARSRKEPGNLGFDVNRDLAVRTRFVFYDRWVSPEAMTAHEQSPHFRTGIERASRLFASQPTVMLVGLVE